MGHILKAIEWLDKQEQQRANIASHTTARLASLVMAIGSQGKADADYTTFLPYLPQDRDGKPRLRPSVVATIQDLIRARRLPMAVVALLVEDIRQTIRVRAE